MSDCAPWTMTFGVQNVAFFGILDGLNAQPEFEILADR